MIFKKILIFIIFLAISFLVFFNVDKPIISPKLENTIKSKTGFIIFPSQEVKKTVTFALIGDLGLGRYITTISRNKKDFSWVFQNVTSVLKSNDFNLANLESPIINNCPEGKTGTFTFCGDTNFLPYLKENKFIFNLANNHIFNYGQDGFNQTKDYLNKNQITYFYSHDSDTEFVKKEINGISFGFLGYDFITNPNLDSNKIINAVKKYNQEVDWLIVSLHWGNEYLKNPESWRINLAHQLIDSGADIIHGHHPHVLQSIEIYKNKPIYYSLGNFVFDQSWSKETSSSELYILKVDKENILESIKKPYLIKQNSQPQFLN
ncbi:MAG: CapA family protein [Candidatus Shapirobacteria bacterium]|nr:CapA family protein [Candidatus Shapirobacteria bacterium]MDD4410097.1 CapA family protein [Candidatus Shapirobacteria bacterium]